MTTEDKTSKYEEQREGNRGDYKTAPLTKATEGKKQKDIAEANRRNRRADGTRQQHGREGNTRQQEGNRKATERQ